KGREGYDAASLRNRRPGERRGPPSRRRIGWAPAFAGATEGVWSMRGQRPVSLVHDGAKHRAKEPLAPTNQCVTPRLPLARLVLLPNVPIPPGAVPMAYDHVTKLIKDHAIEFVDLRFADMRGVQHHVTFPA